MRYIFLEDNYFGFKDSEVNNIEETDIEITEEIYNTFFREQSQGKEFTIKNINGSTFEEIFEKVIIQPVAPQKVEATPFEKLQQENEKLKKQIEETQQSMVEIMNLIEMQQGTPK
ncbi:hypothetical protein [Clostridium oceanicum]|uniref:Uncharacterized protein n=1 Tax=Clostridium oceanicum TaxID=1543 RepID=A0ABN1JCI0_9CLOT